jgi:RNA polymerase sigma-B factor
LSPHAELQALSDNVLLARLRTLPRGSIEREVICEILVSRYAGLVRSCVRPYRLSPEPAEDLLQVGYVGLLKAINNFDPRYGASLGAYAQPCVSGEIKRHFRDRRWQIRVGRHAQELLLEMRAAEEALTQQLGRTPEDSELARHLGVPEDDVREAARPTRSSPPTHWTRRCQAVAIPACSATSSAKTTAPSPTPSTSTPSAPTRTSCPNANSAS